VVGGVATVRVAAGQRLTGSAVAVLRSTTGPVQADLAVCLTDGRSEPASLNGGDFLTVEVAGQGRGVEQDPVTAPGENARGVLSPEFLPGRW